MAYNANIPQPLDDQSQSQPQILANFQALSTWGNGYGHFDLKVSAPSFASGVDGIYNLNNGTTATNELYVHLQRTGGADAPTDVPFTASEMSNNALTACVGGWSYLPSGLLIKWGQGTALSSSEFTVDVATLSSGPVFNKVFQTLITPLWGDSTVTDYDAVLTATGTTTAGNFKMFVTPFDAVKSQFTYLVIGA